MSKLKAAIQAAVELLASNHALLKQARSRHKTWRERVERWEKDLITTQKEAAAAFAFGPNENQLKGEALTRKCHRIERRLTKGRARMQFWTQRIKRQLNRIDYIETLRGDREQALEEWAKVHNVVVTGNRVTGGTPRQRLRAALHTAALNYQKGLQPGYYSQGGAYPQYDHTLIGMPAGHRFDCSSFADGIYLCAGVDVDPSGGNWMEGGYTGTEGLHGKQINPADAQTGDLVLYGPYPHHHVEVVDDGPRRTTIGHGSPPIDAGVFDLFGDGNFVVRSYV